MDLQEEQPQPPPFLVEYLQTLEKVMTIESELMRGVFSPHRGKLGENREAVVQRFFATYLPGRFAVTTGFALIGPAEISTQQDLVIYDRLNHPILFPDSPSVLIPPAAINAVIEVKTSLDGRELQSAVEKGAALKRGLRGFMTQHPQRYERKLEALACVLAFQAADGYLREIPKRLKQLEEEADLEVSDRLDLLCVLGQGIVIGGAYRYHRDNADLPSDRIPEHPQRRIAMRSPNALLLFFSSMLDYITAQNEVKPQLMSYLPEEFGLAQVDGIS